MNRASIFTNILCRNALRREARLPPLDVRAEYRQKVAAASRREVYERRYAVVPAEVVERLRGQRGPGWHRTAGGRWMIDAQTRREPQWRFPLPNRWSPK